MATASASLLPNPEEYSEELARARMLAERYRIDFIDMEEFRIDQDLFRSIPADLMLRYGFVPYRRDGKSLVIVVSDPTDLPMIDELGVILRTPIKVTVGAPSAIQSILKKSESSQRVLEEATEGFQLKVVKEDEAGEDSLTVDKLTNDTSPVIRLVDSTVFTAPNLQWFLDSPTEVGPVAVRSWTLERGARRDTIQLALHHLGTDAQADSFARMTRDVVAEHVPPRRVGGRVDPNDRAGIPVRSPDRAVGVRQVLDGPPEGDARDDAGRRCLYV
jgi:hypothetical protein